MKMDELNVKGVTGKVKVLGDYTIATYQIRKEQVVIVYKTLTKEIASIKLNGNNIPLDDREGIKMIQALFGMARVYNQIEAQKVKKNRKRLNIMDLPVENYEYYSKEDTEIIERTFFVDDKIITIKFYKNSGQIISITINQNQIDLDDEKKLEYLNNYLKLSKNTPDNDKNFSK